MKVSKFSMTCNLAISKHAKMRIRAGRMKIFSLKFDGRKLTTFVCFYSAAHSKRGTCSL